MWIAVDCHRFVLAQASLRTPHSAPHRTLKPPFPKNIINFLMIQQDTITVLSEIYHSKEKMSTIFFTFLATVFSVSL